MSMIDLKKLNNTEIGLISRFLSYAERDVFSLTSKYFKNIFNTAKLANKFPDGTKHNLDTEIIRRLSDPISAFIYEGVDIKNIIKFLEDNDFYLTGGALLQILSGSKFYNKSDLDFISLGTESNNNMNDDIRRMGETFKQLRSIIHTNKTELFFSSLQEDPEETKLYDKIYNTPGCRCLPGETGYPFLPLATYNCSAAGLRNVQLSLITEKKYKSVDEFIYHTADFDFTAISWSFKHKTLWARNIHSIILKQCSFKMSDINWVNAYGCGHDISFEMKENGFDSDYDKDDEEYQETYQYLSDKYSLHTIHTMLTRCRMRKLKYEHRGYSITIEDAEDIDNLKKIN